ncbi:MAG TPA: PPC domain-containing DNA-binding protein [Desulfobacterales bacterium]|nr:PPC domain-containing DNA-binding protein [Desulfobacterales bacterium]
MSSIEGSGVAQIQRLFQFRIKPGADLLQAISEAISEEGISAGVFVSGLGALKRAVFRNLKAFPKKFPVTDEDRLYLEVNAPMELVSLTGWIAPNAGGGVEVHAHFAASTVQDETVVTMGGHLTEGTICGIKCVIAILVAEGDGFQAGEDKKTKSADLFFSPRSSLPSQG